MSNPARLLPDLTGIVEDIAVLKGLPVDHEIVAGARAAMIGNEAFFETVDDLVLPHAADPGNFAEWLRRKGTEA
ncbi:hypothetical protein [Aeromicrobium sp. P5_D10]